LNAAFRRCKSAGAGEVRLPRQKDLLLPESLDPHKDCRVAERARPGSEQVCAQKGVEAASTLLASALLDVEVPPEAGLLVVNLAEYVGEMAGCLVHPRTWP
jgi:hypothetical protein